MSRDKTFLLNKHTTRIKRCKIASLSIDINLVCDLNIIQL